MKWFVPPLLEELSFTHLHFGNRIVIFLSNFFKIVNLNTLQCAVVLYFVISQWSNILQSHFMIWNIRIFQVQICYTMKGIANSNLKTEIVLVCSGFDIGKQDERSHSYASGMNIVSYILMQCLQKGPFEAKFRIKMPGTVYFYPQKLQVQWGTENTKRITLRREMFWCMFWMCVL